MLKQKERTFHTNAACALLLNDLEFHLRRGEIAEAWEYDRELRVFAKLYGVGRYKGMPCRVVTHSRLRQTAGGGCCECLKAAKEARQREAVPPSAPAVS